MSPSPRCRSGPPCAGSTDPSPRCREGRSAKAANRRRIAGLPRILDALRHTASDGRVLGGPPEGAHTLWGWSSSGPSPRRGVGMRGRSPGAFVGCPRRPGWRTSEPTNQDMGVEMGRTMRFWSGPGGQGSVGQTESPASAPGPRFPALTSPERSARWPATAPWRVAARWPGRGPLPGPAGRVFRSASGPRARPLLAAPASGDQPRRRRLAEASS